MSDEITAILQRLQQLEALQPQSTTSVDPHIVQRPAAFDLQPYEDFYRILPDAQNDFFRSPLSEDTRRRFLNQCPSNLDRRYRAPAVQRSVNVGQFTKRFDQQLSDIQYRLSGITRPVDLMAHNLAQGRQPGIHETTDFIRTIHSLLSDVASHITQLRSDNICRDAGLPTVPLSGDSDEDDSLLDTERILEQSKLNKALQEAQAKGRLSRKKKGKRTNHQRSTDDRRHTTESIQVNSTRADSTNDITPRNQSSRPSSSTPRSNNNTSGFSRR